jgi:hypothetical protein
MKYTTYNPTTGEITGYITASNATLAELNLAGQSYIEGQYDTHQYYVADGRAVDKPVKPVDTGCDYVFDWTTQQWTIDYSSTEHNVRQNRNNLLSQIDRVNPVWYQTLIVAQQTELIAYRQALLDVPQQAGFPVTVAWPTKPTWL